MKDDDVDLNAVEKYIDENFDDEKWKKVLKTSCEECHDRLKPKMQEIRAKMEGAPFNIKKDQCDVKFMAFMTCVSLERFSVTVYEWIVE